VNRPTVAFVLIVAAAAAASLLLPFPGRAPDVGFDTTDARRLAMKDYAGRPVLVNFWSISCSLCLHEIPQLSALYRDLGPAGLEVIGVAMSYDPPNLVVAGVEQYGIPYPVAFDADASLARAFGRISATPTWILVGPDGRIVARAAGETDFAALRALIAALPGFPPPAREPLTPSGA
jgi:peroxiredoxin